MKTAALLLLAVLAGAGLSGTAAAAEDTPSVSVNGIRNPEMRSYRSVWAGLDAFDAYRALAPAAPTACSRSSATVRPTTRMPASS